MKVLLLTQYFFPEVGATQTRMYEFARALTEAGHDVTVVAEFPNHPIGVIPPRYAGRWFEDDRSHPFRIVRVRVIASPRKTFYTRIMFYGSFFVMALIAGLRPGDRYDVVVATSPPLPVAAVGLVVSAFKRAAFVMDVRDLWPKAAQALGELSNPRLYRWAEALEQRLYDRADRITATTRRFCRYIADRGIPAAKVIHVPNGTLEAVFSPERGDAGLRQRLGLDGKLVVVFAGLHGIAQDLEMVLDTAVHLRDEDGIAFVFLGEGPRKAALMEAARTQGLDHVRFLPQVPLEESAHYLNLADVVLVPLARDQIFDMFVPSKLFDGLACGKPVLLSVDGEAREILEESGGGLFVPPGDAEALAGAIRHLFRHPEIRKEMGERGRLFVTRHYRRRVQAQRFAEVVADAAGARTERR